MQDGIAELTTSTFRMTCAVQATIAAAPRRVWALLTDAEGFPRWNSTVTSLEGPIELGRRLKLRVPTSERTFAPKVAVFEPPRRMVWADGAAPVFKGVRTFTLEPVGDDRTRFAMVEVFTGLLLPLIRGGLPDFARPFEQYARDLKRAAEESIR